MLDSMFDRSRRNLLGEAARRATARPPSSAVEIAAACLALETGIIPAPQAGRARASPSARRPNAAKTRNHAEVVDRDGRPQLASSRSTTCDVDR